VLFDHAVPQTISPSSTVGSQRFRISAFGGDSVEGCVLAEVAVRNVPTVEAFCVDAGYRGSFELYVQEQWSKPVHVSTRIKDGFAVLPKRWIAERTFAWGNGTHRLSKDYEITIASSEAMLHIAAIHRALKHVRDYQNSFSAYGAAQLAGQYRSIYGPTVPPQLSSAEAAYNRANSIEDRTVSGYFGDGGAGFLRGGAFGGTNANNSTLALLKQMDRLF
jgi:transposase